LNIKLARCGDNPFAVDGLRTAAGAAGELSGRLHAYVVELVVKLSNAMFVNLFNNSAAQPNTACA
jgi:hypothetical protein